MRAASLLLLLSSLAVAQTTGVTLTVDGSDSVAISPSGCGESLTVSWTAQAGAIPCSELTFWSTTGECGEAAAAGDKSYDAIPKDVWPTKGTSTFTIKVSELPMFTASDAGFTCGTLGDERKVKLCAFFVYSSFACGSNETKVKGTAPPTITYDAKAPDAPVIEVLSRDSALTVKLSASDDSETVNIEARVAGEGEFQVMETVASATSDAKITGLSNNVLYEVRAVAFDAAENESAPSEIVTGTPIRTEGFFSDYRNSGGRDQGGCTSAPGGMLLWLAAVVGLAAGGRFLRRGRR
jgi:hypothetical protein